MESTTDDDLFPETQSTLEALSRLATSCGHDMMQIPNYVSHLSIILLHVMYEAALTFLLMPGHFDISRQTNVNTVKERMRDMKPRWRLAGESG
jgi:hypothetical protein